MRAEQLILDPTAPNKNNRQYTKEAWDRVIESEKNQNYAVPVIGYLTDVDFEAMENDTFNPVQKSVGIADCQWEGGNIKLQIALNDETYKNVSFVPAFSITKPEDMVVENGITVINNCTLEYLFACKEPAFRMEVKQGE